MKKAALTLLLLVTVLLGGLSAGGAVAAGGSSVSFAASLASSVDFAGDGKDIVRFGEGAKVGKGQVVSGSLVVFGGGATIAGTVEKDAVIFGGDVKLEPTAHIKGDFVSFGGKVEKAKGARVDGDEVTGKNIQGKNRWHMPSWFAEWLSFYLKTLALLGTMALSALVVALLPNQTERLAREAEAEPWKSLGIGFLAAILVPVALIAVALTLIGLLFIPFLLVALPIIFLYAYVGVSRLVGEKIIERMRATRTSPIIEALLGVLTLGLIGFVPIVGGIIKAVAFFIGLGAVILTKFGTGQPWRRRSEGSEHPASTPPAPPAQS